MDHYSGTHTFYANCDFVQSLCIYKLLEDSESSFFFTLIIIALLLQRNEPKKKKKKEKGKNL